MPAFNCFGGIGGHTELQPEVRRQLQLRSSRPYTENLTASGLMHSGFELHLWDAPGEEKHKPSLKHCASGFRHGSESLLFIEHPLIECHCQAKVRIQVAAATIGKRK
jgi:hypothetical protein